MLVGRIADLVARLMALTFLCMSIHTWILPTSVKYKHAGVRYEVALSIGPLPLIVWIRGGVRCGEWPDKAIATSGPGAIIEYLLPDEAVLCDGTYAGGPHGDKFMTPIQNPQTGNERHYNVVHSRYMARHETINAMFKHFGVARQMFRHPRSYHKECIFALANIINCKLRAEPNSFPSWQEGR